MFLHLPATTALTMGDDGAELSGYGPLPGAIAREIMTGGNSIWRTVLTDPGTGAPKCQYHHSLKSEPDWHIDYDPDIGTTTVTTPSGRSYQHRQRPPRPTEPDVATEATADKTPSETPDDPPF